VPEDHTIAVLDGEQSKYVPLREQPVLPQTAGVDLAYLPNALQRQKAEFLPLLDISAVKVGEAVYSFGYFAIGGNVSDVEQGYFSGKIVNFFRLDGPDDHVSMTLPYPILEGMSGSPVLTYHNGPKVVGIGIGNRTSRILASEVIEYKDQQTEFRETVNRIVEFGVAYHAAAIVVFLARSGIGEFVVSSERPQMPHLE
jgi:hypothetical protein